MNDELKKTSQLEEPSVLDYVKSLLRFGGAKRIQIPSFVEEEQDKSQPARPILTQPEELFVDSIEPKFYPAGQAQTELSDQHSSTLAPEPPVREMQVPFTLAPSTPFPWRSLLAFGLALIAQQALEPPHTGAGLGVAFYIAAFSALGWALYHGEWTLPSIKPTSDRIDPLTYRTIPLLVSLALGLVGFFILTDNLFTKLNVTVWVLAVIFLIWAFWLNRNGLRVTARHLKSLFQREAWTVNISRWTVLLLAAMMLIFFFRFYRTASVPPEPFSDHAEKILDVYDISQGQTHIFFPRNTGREGFQMYWTLLIAKVFGTGLSFLSLKLGTAILGFLTLPFVYLLGKEVGGPRVGFFAFFLTGIGYWPNVISRVGLRFPLYPLFAAPTLLYLIRGLRTHNRNDFLLSGLFLGIGLHGYSPIRIV
ncbi:MAG TPA: glycosyltransferase family 39 protein, partial [Anaerolineales bacterium]|nr:glycosyltransferase family 39 protein [Anaerolineales bacterium]